MDGRPLEEGRWRRRKASQLVKLLALAPGQRLHREQLMEALWPDTTAESAANNLNKIVHLARKALEPNLGAAAGSRFIGRKGDQIRLQAGELFIDAAEFERRASQALKDADEAGMESALALYQGDLLSEDLYEEWAGRKRDQLKILQQNLLLRLAQLAETAGSYQVGVERFHQLLDIEPTYEEAHRGLMRLYALGGNRQQALTQYERCREALRQELDAEPDEQTTRLHKRILSGQMQPAESARQAEPASDQPGHSLAVLPLINAGEDPEFEYLCDGIAESLINSLSRIPRLRVMARSTAFRYKGSVEDPQVIGRKLGVRLVLLGRVGQWGDRLVVGAELVKVSDGSQLWGEQYNRTAADLFTIQEEISTEILEKLRLRLTDPDKKQLQKRYTENLSAYRNYLKGRFHWNKRTALGLKKAIGYFQAAIEEDPIYALAYSGLADCHSLLSLYGAVPPHEAMPRARAAARQALEIDAELAEAHTSLAYVRLYYEWDWQTAEKGFQRSLQLNPNYATARHWYHELLTAMGRFEEEAEQIRLAGELDPLSLIITTEVGWGLYYARRYEEAELKLKKALELDPRFPVVHFILGLVFRQMGRFEEAAAEIRLTLRLLEGGHFPLAVGVLGNIYAGWGEKAHAYAQLSRLQEWSQSEYVPAYALALVYVGLDEPGAAIAQLEQALEERYNRLVFLNLEPLFDNLRDRAEFEQLLRRIGVSRQDAKSAKE